MSTKIPEVITAYAAAWHDFAVIEDKDPSDFPVEWQEVSVTFTNVEEALLDWLYENVKEDD